MCIIFENKRLLGSMQGRDIAGGKFLVAKMVDARTSGVHKFAGSNPA